MGGGEFLRFLTLLFKVNLDMLLIFIYVIMLNKVIQIVWRKFFILSFVLYGCI